MYLLVQTGAYTSKNKLQKAIFDYMTGLDRMAFMNIEAVEAHKKSVKAKLKELHAEHPRCKEVELSGWEPIPEYCSDKTLSVYGLIEMRYYYGIDAGLRQGFDPSTGSAQPDSGEKVTVDGGIKVTDNLIIRVIEGWEWDDDDNDKPVVTQVRIVFRFYGEEAEVFLGTETIVTDEYPNLIQTETVSDLADSFNDQLDDEWETIKKHVMERMENGYQAEV